MRVKKARNADPEDLVAPQDDEEDLVAYWGSNPLDDPMKSLLDASLDSSLVNMPEQDHIPPATTRKSPKVPRVESRTTSRKKKKDRGTALDESAEHQASPSMSGRPGNIRPNDPKRHSHRRSTLGVRVDNQIPVSKPTGFINLGTDCYALSLFQLLARQQSWLRCFSTVRSQDTLEMKVLRIFYRFQQAMREQKEIAFPTMRSDFNGMSVLTQSRNKLLIEQKLD